MNTLSDRALIVRVTATGWTARRFDRASSEQLTDEASATRSAARVNQYLMAGADEDLKTVNQCVREMRDFVEENTVAWDTHGGRLVTPFTWFHMQTRIREIRARFITAVDTFVDNYPTNVDKARVALGALYNPSMFPSVHAVASLFNLTIVPESLPLAAPSDPRYGMTATELDTLREQISRTVEERMEESLLSQWKRLREEVARLHTSLTPREDGKRTPLFETTLEKLRNTAQVLREMNITDNRDIDQICGDVTDALRDVGIDTLRLSDTQRSDVHSAMESALTRINGILL